MYQKLIIAGYLGDEPQLRYTPSGDPSCGFSVATSKKWSDKAGQQHEQTVWFRVTAWRRLAETCAQYLHKGRPVLVEGELREPHAWQGRDGEWRASLEVVAMRVQFLPWREQGQGASGTTQAAAPEGAVSPIEVDSLDEQEIPF